MRNLKLSHLILWTCLACGALSPGLVFFPSSAFAAGCGSMEAVSQLIKDAKIANRTTSLWESGEWGGWEKKIQAALKESGYKGDVIKVTKSLRRNLDHRLLKPALGARSAEVAEVAQVQTSQASANAAARASYLKMDPSFPLERKALKSLETFRKSNPTVYENYMKWEKRVEEKGLMEVRKIPGYHDEPLQQLSRAGQHSVRLNNGYRVFYKIDEATGKMVIVDVNLHKY
ncbi:MAG: hypothetical protein H7222_13890 [Methylotenera sp.]|nr:hypothetical protein [Oligoflexia bacterium]